MTRALRMTASAAALAFAAAAGIGAASAAGKIALDLSGYFVAATTYVFADDEDFFGFPLPPGDDMRGFRIAREAEVHLRGRTVLDNGLVVGAEFQLETDENGEDLMDEAWIFVRGGFGTIQFGANDGVGDQMPVVAPSPFLETFANDTSLDPFGGDDGGILTSIVSTTLDASGDAEKISWISPRVQGFQVGVSYSPEAECEEQEFTSIIDDGFALDCGGFGAGALEDTFEIAINYARDFGDVTLEASFAWLTGDQGTDSREDWSLGLAAAYRGFKIGGAYAEKESPFFGTTLTSYNLGATYATGPWTFGLEWGRGEIDFFFGDVEQDRFVGGFAYDLGPGVTITAGGAYTDTQDFADGSGFALFSEFGVRF